MAHQSEQRLTISEQYNESLVQELESITDSECKEPIMTSFKTIAALLTILTSCDADGHKGDSCFCEIHGRIFSIFKRLIGCEERSLSIERPVLRNYFVQQPVGPNEEGSMLWKLSDATSLYVPYIYSDGLTAASLYLLLKDASSSFASFIAENGSINAIEIPCLLEMVLNSSSNNYNNPDALLGEYLALIRICFHLGCQAPEHFYRCETQKFDFTIKFEDRKTGVSVKSVKFTTAKYFSSAERHEKLLWTMESKPLRLLSKVDGENILLHNCQCEECLSHPVQKVEIKLQSGIRTVAGLNCRRKERFETILKDLKFGVVYLVLADLYYELRFALCTFSQKTFRGAQNDFPLRDFCCQKLRCCAQQHCAKKDWISTLKDRSE